MKSKPKSLPAFVKELQRGARYSFTRAEASQALGSRPDALTKALQRLVRANRLCQVQRGFYAIVPVEYEFSGSPPTDWFIDKLMGHIGQPYYAGVLTAAAMHGTALHKLSLHPPRRYSEDIDLVQVQAGPIGPIYDGVQKVLNPWLGSPSRKRGPGVPHLIYRMETTGPSVVPLKLKVEINTREHFSIAGFVDREFSATSRWYTGQCNLMTYSLEELLGTKMRALFQRRKGRDLFDLWLGLTEGGADPEIVVSIFRQYMHAEGTTVSRQEYLDNLTAKMVHPGFARDVAPLLVDGKAFTMNDGFSVVESLLLPLQ